MSNIRPFKRKVDVHEQDVAKKRALEEFEAIFDIDPAVAMTKEHSLWFCWLHPMEWKAMFALSAALVWRDQMPDSCDDLQGQMLHAMKLVQREHGYQFLGLHITPDDELFVKEKEPLSKMNMLWIKMIQRGEFPEYLEHIGFTRGWLAQFAPHLVPMVADFYNHTRNELEKSRSVEPDEEERAMVQQIAAAKREWMESRS